MSGLDDIINNMPQMTTKSDVKNSDFLTINRIIRTILDWLGKELPNLKLNIKSDDVNGLSRDVLSLNRALDSLDRNLAAKNDTLGDAIPQVTGMLQNLSDTISKINLPEIPAFPEKIQVDLSESDIKKLTPKSKEIKIPDSVSVNNLNTLKRSIDEITEILLENTKDDILKALKPLENLSQKAGKPLSVRLSDGKKFIKELKGIVDQQQRGMQQILLGGGGGSTRIRPQETVVSGFKALSSAATAAQVSATSAEIDYVEITVTGGVVAVGDSSAVATSGSEVGVVLYPGNTPYRMNISNINKLYAAGASGSRVCYNYHL